MRIGELATASGVSVRSLRYYEQQGLLASERTSGGQRRYHDDAVGRVELIQRLYSAALCSEKIAELLPCFEGRPSPALRSSLLVEKARVDGMIRDLEQARGVLVSVIDSIPED
ncbi:MerR family transcriptional regulator [Micromonospora sp. NBC_01796]|uniref:MerR family transcriptional regulator n=1 Tax=Micromonospora sp. NBC_01796 TaxID=2975987 RepID=UPI002DD9BFBA|nr:MerR family transcriptional regulator [Micromonospora sp. NBC_01796]WSA85651.1 MerR family transcriptional regulator [Micromonospora sp. NBC_01796]